MCGGHMTIVHENITREISFFGRSICIKFVFQQCIICAPTMSKFVFKQCIKCARLHGLAQESIEKNSSRLQLFISCTHLFIQGYNQNLDKNIMEKLLSLKYIVDTQTHEFLRVDPCIGAANTHHTKQKNSDYIHRRTHQA